MCNWHGSRALTQKEGGDSGELEGRQPPPCSIFYSPRFQTPRNNQFAIEYKRSRYHSGKRKMENIFSRQGVIISLRWYQVLHPDAITALCLALFPPPALSAACQSLDSLANNCEFPHWRTGVVLCGGCVKVGLFWWTPPARRLSLALLCWWWKMSWKWVVFFYSLPTWIRAVGLQSDASSPLWFETSSTELPDEEILLLSLTTRITVTTDPFLGFLFFFLYRASFILVRVNQMIHYKETHNHKCREGQKIFNINNYKGNNVLTRKCLQFNLPAWKFC